MLTPSSLCPPSSSSSTSAPCFTSFKSLRLSPEALKILQQHLISFSFFINGVHTLRFQLWSAFFCPTVIHVHFYKHFFPITSPPCYRNSALARFQRPAVKVIWKEILVCVCLCVGECYSMTTFHLLAVKHDPGSITHPNIKRPVLRSRVAQRGLRAFVSLHTVWRFSC